MKQSESEEKNNFVLKCGMKQTFKVNSTNNFFLLKMMIAFSLRSFEIIEGFFPCRFF